MYLENRSNGDVPDVGSPPDVPTALAAENTNRTLPITEEEWRRMLAAVRHLPHNRGTILLIPFRSCIGKISLTVSAQILHTVKKERVQSVQTLQELITEINQCFRARNRTTPFTIHRNPAHGVVESYTLNRWKKPPKTEYRNISDVILVAKPETHIEIEIPVATEIRTKSPDDSDLSDEDWQYIESLLATTAGVWKWHKLIEAIWKARPCPIPLSVLDEIAQLCGHTNKYVWGAAIDKLNACLVKKNCHCRIMKMPSERRLNNKGKHNVYEGHVTLYQFNGATSNGAPA